VQAGGCNIPGIRPHVFCMGPSLFNKMPVVPVAAFICNKYAL